MRRYTAKARTHLLLRSTSSAHRLSSTLQTIRQQRYASSTPNPAKYYDEDNPDHRYWWNACSPSLTSILQHSNTYTPAQQALQLTWFLNKVIPNLGPRPSSTYRLQSPLNYDGTPYRPTWNFGAVPSSGNKKIKGTFRFSFEPIPPAGTATTKEDPTNQASYQRLIPLLAKTCHGGGGALDTDDTKADLTWYNEVKTHLYLTPSEQAILHSKLAPGQHPPEHTHLAIGLLGSKRILKPYLFAGPKSLATGLSPHTVLFSALRSIRTQARELKPSLDMVESYVSSRSDIMTPSCIGIDAISPSQGARIKLYTTTPNNDYDTMRDAMKMGERLTSRENLRGAGILRQVYHLLRGEASSLEKDKEGRGVSKRCRYGETRGKEYCLAFTSYEMRPGREEPEVKIYLPIMQFFETEGQVVQALERVGREFGWFYSGKGGYEEAFREAFPRVDLNEPPGTHTWLSFSYSKKTGPYMTVYYAPRFQEAYDRGLLSEEGKVKPKSA